MNKFSTFIFLSILSLTLTLGAFQDAFKVEQTQFSYYQADSAVVEPFEEKVLIFAEGLIMTPRYGVQITIVGQDNKYIEVHPENKPFPPMVITPISEGVYRIFGKVGEKFYVSVRSENAPYWFEVTISPPDVKPEDPVEPDDPQDPPTDLGKFEEMIKKYLPNDPPTASAFSSAYLSALTKVTKEDTLDQVKLKVVEERRKAALLLPALNQVWSEFLTTISDHLETLKTKDEYLKHIEFLAKKLAETKVTNLSVWERSAIEDKLIVVVITGTEWCSWCQLMEREIINTDKFREWSKDFIVHYGVFDAQLRSDEFSSQLRTQYKVTSFPTILFIDKDKKEVARLGYLASGADNWIKVANSRLK